jgi:hypothetical protein
MGGWDLDGRGVGKACVSTAVSPVCGVWVCFLYGRGERLLYQRDVRLMYGLGSTKRFYELMKPFVRTKGASSSDQAGQALRHMLHAVVLHP